MLAFKFPDVLITDSTRVLCCLWKHTLKVVNNYLFQGDDALHNSQEMFIACLLARADSLLFLLSTVFATVCSNDPLFFMRHVLLCICSLD